MERLKKILRILGFIVIIILAAAGAGITGAFLPTQRDPYQHKDIRIEQVDKKEEETEEVKEKKPS